MFCPPIRSKKTCFIGYLEQNAIQRHEQAVLHGREQADSHGLHRSIYS